MSGNAGRLPHHMLKVATLGSEPSTVRFCADVAEREALAKAWGVLGVDSLDADLEARRWRRDGVQVHGVVHLRLTQQCVVTLDPIESVIEAPVDIRLVPEGSRLAEGGRNDVVVDPEAPDPPDVFEGNAIDLGVIACEFAAMAIDPYPRKPAAAFPPHIETPEEDDEASSPFAALKAWRERDG